MADDGRCRLFGVELPRSLLATLDAYALGAQQGGAKGVVLKVGAGRVTPGVPSALVLLAEQALQAGAVFGREAPLLAYAPVPVLRQSFGHLDRKAVQVEVVAVAVRSEQAGCLLGDRRAHAHYVEGHIIAHIMRLNGIDAELLDRGDVMRLLPYLDFSSEARFPIYGGLLQRRAGTVRHDAVAWGYARAADALGVDIIENCEVKGFIREKDRIVGVATNRGTIRAARTAISVAGHTSHLAAMAGLRLPVESHLLQACVTEPIKPFVDHVISFGAELFYISQSDKGGLVFGGHIDGYNSYTQRGQFAKIQSVAECAVALIPSVSRLRLLRHWGGIQDMTPDGSPFICRTPIAGLYLNGGWCYQGFKATPAAGACFAHTIANDDEHPLVRHLGLDRFRRGNGHDEYGLGLWTYRQ